MLKKQPEHNSDKPPYPLVKECRDLMKALSDLILDKDDSPKKTEEKKDMLRFLRAWADGESEQFVEDFMKAAL